MSDNDLVQNDAGYQQIAAARGQADAALILTMAGLGWMILGLSALGKVPLRLLLPVVVVFALLLAGTFALQKSMRALPPAAQSPRVEKVFKQATIFECIAIAIVVLVAGLLHKPEFIMPLVALAVGLHFFPLARALRRPLYYVTGVALCALGISAFLFVPSHWGAHAISGWRLAAGLGGGTILWLTTIALLCQAQMLLRKLMLPPA